MQRFVFIVCFFGLAGEARAENVAGTVFDVTTAAPVQGARVQVAGRKTATTTNSRGRFSLSLETEQALEVSAPGYETVTVTGSPGSRAIKVWLLPQGMREVIEVRDRLRKTRPPGTTPLEREEVTVLPGARGDALTAIKSLPGIANNGALTPGSAGIIIRGSSPKDSRIFVDGFDIPILYHFLGLQSVFATEMIERIEVKPGGFGVEQGQASGGTIAVTSRKGSREYAGAAEVSFVNVSAFAQGPLGKKGSFAVAMRRSLIDTVVPLVLPSDSPVSFTTLPRYWDFQARLDYDVSSAWDLSMLVFGTDDGANLLNGDENPDDPVVTGRFKNDTSFLRAIASADYAKNDVVGRFALSGFSRTRRFEIGNDRFLKLDDLSVGFRGTLEVPINTQVRLKTGAEGELFNADVDLRFPRPPREGDGELPSFSFDPIIETRDKFNRNNLAAWTALIYEPMKQLQFEGGVRVDAFLRPREFAVQPRGNLRLNLDRKTSLIGAAGVYTRPPYNLDENLQTDLKPEKAIQYVAGVERTLFPGATLQASGFYTDRSNLIVFATDRMDAGADAGYVNAGEGRSYGGELLLKYRTKRTFAWLAYTLSKSERRDGDDPMMRPFDFDQTHNLVITASRVLGKARHWRIGGRFQLTSGNPFTPVTSATYQSDLDYYLPQFGEANSERLETQHQLDVRVDRVWRFDDWKLSAFLDISNVYLNAAVVDYQYNYDYSERTEFTSLPIVPSIGVRGEF